MEPRLRARTLPICGDESARGHLHARAVRLMVSVSLRADRSLQHLRDARRCDDFGARLPATTARNARDAARRAEAPRDVRQISASPPYGAFLHRRPHPHASAWIRDRQAGTATARGGGEEAEPLGFGL